VALGGIESGTSRNTWRYPDAEAAQYFQTLAAWGYPLCPVERIAARIQDDAAPSK
jgi:ParB family chromosome partitioning protein